MIHLGDESTCIVHRRARIIAKMMQMSAYDKVKLLIQIKFQVASPLNLPIMSSRK